MSETRSEPNAPMSGAELGRLLELLAEPSTTAAEAEARIAELDGQEARVALPLFARLRDARDPAELRAVARILVRWTGRPVARALVPALQALLQEGGVADLNRMTAAGLLEQLGEPVDYPDMLARMGDLDAVARRAAASELSALAGPAECSAALEQLARMPVEQVLAFVDDLRQLGDRRAAPLLAALAHAGQADVAVSAVAAIDELALVEARPGLMRVARAHPDAITRAQAARTLERFAAREAGSPRRSPGLEAWGSEPGPAGARILVLLCARPEGLRDGLSLVLDPELGLGGHALAEGLDDAAFERLRSDFARGGRPLAPLALDEAGALLEAAARLALSGGRCESVAHLPWLEALNRSGHDLDAR